MRSTEAIHRTGRPFDPDDNMHSISGVYFQDYLYFCNSAILCLARYNEQQLLSDTALSGYSVKWKLCSHWGRNWIFVYYYPNFRFEMVMLRQFMDFIMPFLVMSCLATLYQFNALWREKWSEKCYCLKRKVQEWAMVYWTRCTIICLEKIGRIQQQAEQSSILKAVSTLYDRCIVNVLIITVIKLAFINLSKRYRTSTLFYRNLVKIFMCEYYYLNIRLMDSKGKHFNALPIILVIRNLVKF